MNTILQQIELAADKCEKYDVPLKPHKKSDNHQYDECYAFYWKGLYVACAEIQKPINKITYMDYANEDFKKYVKFLHERRFIRYKELIIEYKCLEQDLKKIKNPIFLNKNHDINHLILLTNKRLNIIGKMTEIKETLSSLKDLL